MSEIILGIDLGTTFSSAAYIDEATGRPAVLKTVDEKNALPSVVQIENGVVKAVGELALNQWKLDEAHVVRWIKRAMGEPDYRFQGMSAVEISAEILKSLKKSAEEHFGVPVTKAVITCPAYFGGIEIAATRDAGILAGFEVLEIIKEPTAAAVHFGVDHMEEDETILVCDLGGGTYDATILHHSKGVFSPLATSGDRKMGGHDWTSDLFDMVKNRFYEETGIDLDTDLAATQMLYEECERAKKDFARASEAFIPCSSGGRSTTITITRDDFEEATSWRMAHLVDVTKEALAKGKLGWKDISRILLVGGSSRLRAMKRVLEEASGITPVQSNEPDLAVACGAAICAVGKVRSKRKPALAETGKPVLVELEIKRIIARSLGTRAIVQDGGKRRIGNALLIPHSTEVPEQGLEISREDFEISAQGQTYVNVPVVEFEDDGSYDLIGNFQFTFPPGSSKGDKIQVIFHYDKNAIPTVTAKHAASGRTLERKIVPYVEPEIVDSRPRWVLFVIDLSGSMESHNKIGNAKEAVRNNCRQLLSADEACQIGVISFDSGARVVCQPTRDFEELVRKVDSMAVSGTTAMDRGILEALALAGKAPAETVVDIVLLTDGMPDNSANTRSAAERLKSDGKERFTLATLGVGKDEVDENFLKQLTPISLVIDRGGDFSGSMGTLLTQSAASRSGRSQLEEF